MTAPVTGETTDAGEGEGARGAGARGWRAAVEALAARHYDEGVGEWSGRPHVCGGCGHDWPCSDRRAIDEALAVCTVDDSYICPTTAGAESRTLGGFDVCCDHPRCPGNPAATPDADDASTRASECLNEADDHYVMEVDAATGALTYREPRAEDAFCPHCHMGIAEYVTARVSAAATRAAGDRAEQTWDEGHRQFCAMQEHYNADHVHPNLNPYRAARIARTTP